ncbi:MAG TPA: hypothetical protein VGK76_09210 [Candidatus Eisenbacteria bacterium]
MIERLRRLARGRAILLIGLFSVAYLCFQIGRLLRTERLITGSELSLPLDDSFIYLQYARAIAEGHPFVYAAGNAPTTGATSLLWPFLLAPPHWLHLGPMLAIAWALALGAVALLVSALLMARLGRLLAGTLGMLLAVVLFLGNPHLLWGYMSGMEIGLYATVLLGTLVLYLNEREGGTFPRLRWCLFLLAASRPEGAVLSGVLGLVMAHDRWRASRADHGPRFWSAALLMPFAAAALPFLVNLAVSGSIESTSSQAKSILAEPHPDVRRKFLTDSPKVWLSIVMGYLSWLQLDGEGNLIQRYWIPSAAALALFAAFSFLPRHRPWSDGRALLLLFPAAVVVDSLPVVWAVHLYRYQQGFYPILLACFATGLARAGTLAWGRLPRAVGAPLAAFIVVAPLAAWSPTATEVYDRVILFYGHNCENILHQQVKVGRWIEQNLPRNAVVGMNDAGAIAYYGNRQTLDLLGLTTEGFAKVYRAGIGCMFEKLRRLPPRKLPTYFAIYPEWFPYLQSSGVLGPEIFRAHLGANTICGGENKVVYPAQWIDVVPADSMILPHPEIEGMKLRDSFDLAWLEDERRHDWKAYGYEYDEKRSRWKRNASVLPRDVLRQYVYADRPTRPIADAGRKVFGWERFRVKAEPGKDLTLVMRTDAWYPNRLTVSVDGSAAGAWTIARSETVWVEPAFKIPGRLVAGARPEIEIRREDPQDGGDYAPFHYWIFQ